MMMTMLDRGAHGWRQRRVVWCVVLVAGLAIGPRAPVTGAQADTYDVVLRGGRVHAHGQTNQANEFQAHDGVTTALELESGQPFVDAWLASRTGNALIHFGATIGHSSVRWRAMERYAPQARDAVRIVRDEGLDSEALAGVGRATVNARYEALTAAELTAMRQGLDAGLADGALGIGVPVGYYPGATREEIFRVYAFAAERDAPVFTHVRDVALGAIQEAIADAAVTGRHRHHPSDEA